MQTEQQDIVATPGTVMGEPGELPGDRNGVRRLYVRVHIDEEAFDSDAAADLAGMYAVDVDDGLDDHDARLKAHETIQSFAGGRTPRGLRDFEYEVLDYAGDFLDPGPMPEGEQAPAGSAIIRRISANPDYLPDFDRRTAPVPGA